MKIKKIKIGIKDLKTMLDDFVKTGEAIERGEKPKPAKGPEVNFTSFEALRKVLTPKRLELLHTIKTKKPSSINELARMAKRDLKNVADDVKYLEQVGLIEKKKTAKNIAPVVTYDKLSFEMAV
jgi:predicted transcriptional regulator